MVDGFLITDKNIGLFTTSGTNPPPTSRHRDVAKQRFAEAEDVKTLHA